jgi:GT2 family glycosyltransferase
VQASFVVVTWNCADALAVLVASMNRRLDPERAELVVVDNDSDDEPFGAARRWHGRLVTHALPENRGFGAAANVGVRLATCDAVVLLNPDTWLVDDSLLELGAAALELGAIVGPRVLDPDGTAQPSASASPVGVWPWVRALVPVALTPKAVVARTEPWRLETATPVAWLTGACLAASRELLLRLGPFDETLDMYAEDMELGLRAADEGARSLFRPDLARVVHVGDRSSSRRYRDRGVTASATNAMRVILRRYGRRRARRAVEAECLRLALRVHVKRAIGSDAAHDAEWLRAVARARAEVLGIGDGAQSGRD